VPSDAIEIGMVGKFCFKLDRVPVLGGARARVPELRPPIGARRAAGVGGAPAAFAQIEKS
jgi:hypothetical protein